MQIQANIFPVEQSSIDRGEPIILCTFYLPYKVVSNPKKPSEFMTR